MLHTVSGFNFTAGCGYMFQSLYMFIKFCIWRKIFSSYRQVSNIRRTKSQHLKDCRTVLRLSLPNPLKPDVKSRMTTSEWSTILLPTRLRLILETLRYVKFIHLFIYLFIFYTIQLLTHWSLNKIADISQMTFSTQLSENKPCVFWFKLPWGLFPRVQFTMCQHWLICDGLSPSKWQVITCTNDDPVYLCIFRRHNVAVVDSR